MGPAPLDTTVGRRRRRHPVVAVSSPRYEQQIRVDGHLYRSPKGGHFWLAVEERDAGPMLACCDERDVFLDHIHKLERWKAEATRVLARWDDVAAMVPATLGFRKSDAVAQRIDALEAELARFVPTDTWWETFIARDGNRSMRARTDLYRRQGPA